MSDGAAAQNENIVETIFRETAGLADKAAVIEGGRTVTYGALRGAVERASAALERAGIRPGRRVAFVCADGIDYVTLCLAVLHRNAAVAPVSPSLMRDELAALVERMDVHAVIGDAQTTPWPGARDLPPIEGVTGRFWLAPREPRQPDPPGFADMHPAFVRFSSGTTGASKGVVLSHRAIRERTDAADRGLRMTSADEVLWVLSMSFHFVVTILLFLRRGVTIRVCGEPMPAGLIAALRLRRATFLYASPTHYRLLTGAPGLAPDDFKGVRLAISTAAKMPAETAAAFLDRFGLEPVEAYGIIEVGLPFINLPGPGWSRGSLGRALPGYEVRLAAGNEVWIRGPGMFDAYYSPWRTRPELYPDGWFRTGDVGETDDTGRLRLVGRCKEVINFAGMKVFPLEVEEALNAHPGVVESQVFGEPHPVFGQVPGARVVWRAAAGAWDEGVLAAFCRARLAVHKVPKTFIRVDALEKTASGKIKRA